MIEYKLGSELPLRLQDECKRRFVHRHTGDHKPQWTQGTNYPLQFADDADWLAHTHFAVRKDGNLHKGVRFCNSTPTWPNGKGVYGQKGIDW